MKKLSVLILLLIISGIKPAFSYEFRYGLSFMDYRMSKDSVKKHSPHKASIYSAILPGLGQAYNRKYWKIPIVYAALGGSTYWMLVNRDSMRQRQDALKAMLDNDPNTVPADKYALYPTSVLQKQRDLYRTNRDYSIIAMAAFYVLNIVDAAVDAHFYKFNIDQPLAARKERKIHLANGRVGHVPTIGLSYRF